MVCFFRKKMFKCQNLLPNHKITCVLIYLFGVLRHFQNCTGHITLGSWKGRGNQYIQFDRFLYCNLPTNGKQLPVFPLEAMPRTKPRPQRWEARVLPLCHRGPLTCVLNNVIYLIHCTKCGFQYIGET